MRSWILVFCVACGVEDAKDGDFVHEGRGADDTAVPADDGCDPGTTLDGDACVDIDECEEDNGGCGAADLYDCINREAADPICRFNPTQDWEALMKGIDGLSFGGSYASTIISHGDHAFPVVLDTANRAVVAAARMGDGRILHVGHEGVLNSHQTLVLNAVHWMSEESPVIGVHADQAGLGEMLSAEGYTVETRTATQLAGVDIWVGNVYTDLGDEDYVSFQSFIEDGGGVITGGHAWYWSYSNDNAAQEHPGNRMLWGSGLTITQDYSAPGDLPVTQIPDFPRVQASWALDEMLLHQSGEYPLEMDLQVLAAGTVSYAVSILPLSFDAYYDRIRDFRAEVSDVTPTAEDPVIPADDPIRGLVVSIDNRFAKELPPDELEAWPGVADFPGAVPEDASRLAVSLEIDASYAGRDSSYWYSGAGADVWRSTGLYIPAGEQVRVVLSASAVDSGLTALIGAHTDSIWGHDEWSRMPEMTRSYALQSIETIVASAFGGLLYIRVPGGTDLGSIEVTVDGAVEAPRFVLGETSNEAWTAGIRDLPGPWAELASESFILTVPSAQVRELDDPEALMSLWRDVLEGDNALLGLEPEDRVRAERMVFDRQISAGWMHSGYPTMGPRCQRGREPQRGCIDECWQLGCCA